MSVSISKEMHWSWDVKGESCIYGYVFIIGGKEWICDPRAMVKKLKSGRWRANSGQFVWKEFDTFEEATGHASLLAIL